MMAAAAPRITSSPSKGSEWRAVYDLPSSLKWKERHLQKHLPHPPPTADFPSHLLGQKQGTCPHPALGPHILPKVKSSPAMAEGTWFCWTHRWERRWGRWSSVLAWWRAEAVSTSGKNVPCSLRKDCWGWRWPQSPSSSPCPTWELQGHGREGRS